MGLRVQGFWVYGMRFGALMGFVFSSFFCFRSPKPWKPSPFVAVVPSLVKPGNYPLEEALQEFLREALLKSVQQPLNQPMQEPVRVPLRSPLNVPLRNPRKVPLRDP